MNRIESVIMNWIELKFIYFGNSPTTIFITKYITYKKYIYTHTTYIHSRFPREHARVRELITQRLPLTRGIGGMDLGRTNGDQAISHMGWEEKEKKKKNNEKKRWYKRRQNWIFRVKELVNSIHIAKVFL